MPTQDDLVIAVIFVIGSVAYWFYLGRAQKLLETGPRVRAKVLSVWGTGTHVQTGYVWEPKWHVRYSYRWKGASYQGRAVLDYDPEPLLAGRSCLIVVDPNRPRKSIWLSHDVSSAEDADGLVART